MFSQKKNKYDDATTNELMANGIYSVHNPYKEEKRIWINWKEHNILSGMWYVFILSCLLWWLPVFGQMIAGYIGGRRAGSPTKGIIVSIIPVFIIMLLFIGMDIGVLPFLVALAQIPSMVMNGIQSISPHAAEYIGGIFVGLEPLIGINANGFLIVIVFGLIGGMMADLNKKEIAKATGDGHMFGAFSDRFSAAGLNKFADMVAERVMWTMGTMESGGRSLIPTRYRQPQEMGFADLKMLPASTGSHSSLSAWQEPVSNQPPQTFEYENPYQTDERLEGVENLTIETVPVEPLPRDDIAYDEDWGIKHFDLSEESMTKKWIEQNKNLESKKPRKRYGKSTDNRSERLYGNDISPKRREEKRDAMIYDGKGNELISSPSKSKNKRAKPKKKQPALIERAIAADKKINSEPQEKIVEPEPEPDEEQIIKKAMKARPKQAAQSYERL
jgi:hypothetical protein